jgi:site-specific DNA recombinase
LDGWGHMKIAHWLNRTGIPTYKGLTGSSWQTFQVMKILRNMKYIGKNFWDREIYDAEYPGIVSLDKFVLAQRILGEKKSTTPRSSNYEKFMLLGLLRCGECGRRMRIKANNFNKPSGGCYYYACYDALMYRNGCKHGTLHRQIEVDSFIDQFVRLEAAQKIPFCDVAENKQADLSSIYKQRLLKISSQLDKAKNAYLNDIFTLEEYKTTKDKLELEMKIVESEVYDREDKDIIKYEMIKKFENGFDVWDSLRTPLERKNKLLEYIHEILLMKDGTIRISLTPK